MVSKPEGWTLIVHGTGPVDAVLAAAPKMIAGLRKKKNSVYRASLVHAAPPGPPVREDLIQP